MRLLSKLKLLFAGCFSVTTLQAQPPKVLTPSELYHQVEKLNVLASALYIAAHPDDENTQLISYLANEVKAETAYLSLTRGNGGQNLISDQLNDYLGIIRTQELLNARKIDGGMQYFSSANDFGFSKSPQEAFEKWDKNLILSQIVYSIRALQPDVIINRFDHRKEGITHGHHTASAQLSKQAFDLSGDKQSFAPQLKNFPVWQPKRLFFNVSWFFFGGKEAFEKADKSGYIPLQIGFYYPLLGKSNQEIASASRSQHQSQGFGDMSSRGEQTEYLEPIAGSSLKDAQNLFDGIDTSWNRVKGGEKIGGLIQNLLDHFDFKKPENNIASLLTIYEAINKLENSFWKERKLAEVKQIIAQSAGLFLEVATENQVLSPGSSQNITIEVTNRSNAAITVTSIKLFNGKVILPVQKALAPNKSEIIQQTITIPEDVTYTDSPWLKNPETAFFDQFSSSRQMDAIFTLDINHKTILLNRPLVYKYKDRVKGEVYDAVHILPQVNITPVQNLYITVSNHSIEIPVKFEALQKAINGKARLVSDSGNATPWQKIHLTKKHDISTLVFSIQPQKEETFTIYFETENQRFNQQAEFIHYSHIPTQVLMKTAQVEVKKMDIKIENKKIGYLMGAGDKIPESLRDLGYDVTLLNENSLTAENLKQYQAVILGIRAYNTQAFLAQKQAVLMNYVKKGGNLITQYNTNTPLFAEQVGPYPLHISTDRVTDEEADITFLQPGHPVLRFPNPITENDFKGWVQEQGLYYANEFDNRYDAIFSSHDKGETAKKGGLLIAPYGKGNFVYTGLSFFRQLPAGVTGAYKIFANLIALPQHHEKR